MESVDNQLTPSLRLKKFFDSTGMSVRDFAKEIGSPEKFRTLYSVFNEERQPNPKLVRQIIERFPQLSFDWIYVGAGNMFLSQSSNMVSGNDLEASTTARVNQAMDRLDRLDFAVNELANQINRTLTHQAEMTNIFFGKIDSLTTANNQMQQSCDKASAKMYGVLDSIENAIEISKQSQIEYENEQKKLIKEMTLLGKSGLKKLERFEKEINKLSITEQKLKGVVRKAKN